jgi:hypothetical protein
MKHAFLSGLTIFLLVVLILPQQPIAQASMPKDLRFEVRRFDPPLPITQQQLEKVQRLADLNNEGNALDVYFRPSWIRSYVSVELVATQHGKKRSAVGKNDILTPEQLDILRNADPGTPVAVHIQYMPENTLSHNDVQTIDFECNVMPLRDARFTGGQPKLEDYLTTHAIQKIPADSFQPTDFAAVLFTISESGKVIDAHVFDAGYQPDPHDKVNAILLDAVRKMPSWEPAEFCKGTSIRQNFVLVVGNLESCNNNLISFR